MFHDLAEIEQTRQTSCECCGRWFWFPRGGYAYCDQCKADKEVEKRKKQADRELYIRNRVSKSASKEAMQKATVMWEYIVANREEGARPYRAINELIKAGLTEHRGSTDIMTCLEYTWHLVYTANGRLYPYKNLNTGEEF